MRMHQLVTVAKPWRLHGNHGFDAEIGYPAFFALWHDQPNVQPGKSQCNCDSDEKEGCPNCQPQCVPIRELSGFALRNRFVD